MKRRHRLLERDLKPAKNVPLLSINLIDYSHISHYLGAMIDKSLQSH